jgi:EmrB/QacA subfamily drug resistance transporter
MNREASVAVWAERRRWIAFSAICLGVLMIVLDGTIVYVALPSIRRDLTLTDQSLVWVANSYTLTYTGFLLLGGRLGDSYGHRRMFLVGIGLFTLASVGCGLSVMENLLVVSRGVQGLGGALVLATAGSLLLNTFPSDAGRVKASGLLAFVSVGGSSVGLLLGGIITSALNWHWIFLVNLPFGVSVYALVLRLFPPLRSGSSDKKIDFWGAGTVTASLVLATYGTLNEGQVAGDSGRLFGSLISASILFAVFLTIQSRIENPLVPLSVFRRRDFALASVVNFFSGICTASLFFVGLYVQLVLGRGPMQAGLAFLPMSATAAVFAFGLSSRIVSRFGIRRPLSIGLSVAALSLALLARVPVTGSLAVDVLPSTVLFGIGMGLAGSSLLLAATRDASPGESGLISGVYSTTALVGGMFGLAILANLSAGRAEDLISAGMSARVALAQGYRVALLGGATCATVAALIAGLFLRTTKSPGDQACLRSP